MKRAMTARIPALVLALLACVPAHAAETIIFGGVGAGSSLGWPLYAGMAKGFYAAHNVALDIIAVQSSAQVVQQVAAGALNLGEGGMVDPIHAVDQGARVAILRTEAVVAPYSVLSKASLKRLADLKGKTIMVGGAKDITRLYVERMLAGNGVKPGEFDLVYAGATAARYAALSSGAIDATILTPPFNFRGETDGFTNLGLAMDYSHDFPFTGYSVNVAWGKQHVALLKGFLAGYGESVDWFYDTSHRAEAAKILVEIAHSDIDDALKTYDFYVRLKLWDRAGAVSEEQLGNLLTVMKALGDLEGAPDPKRFIDAELGALAAASR
jgi:NitT/TauT family transport system substrate-binding protein